MPYMHVVGSTERFKLIATSLVEEVLLKSCTFYTLGIFSWHLTKYLIHHPTLYLLIASSSEIEFPKRIATVNSFLLVHMIKNIMLSTQ
jgi:hypothetical protein